MLLPSGLSRKFAIDDSLDARKREFSALVEKANVAQKKQHRLDI